MADEQEITEVTMTLKNVAEMAYNVLFKEQDDKKFYKYKDITDETIRDVCDLFAAEVFICYDCPAQITFLKYRQVQSFVCNKLREQGQI